MCIFEVKYFLTAQHESLSLLTPKEFTVSPFYLLHSYLKVKETGEIWDLLWGDIFKL